MGNRETALDKNIIHDNVISLKQKDVNVNIDGEIISLLELEKIFFLSRLNSDPSFTAGVLGLDVKKVDKIINSCRFQEIVNEYLSEYITGKAGEKPEQLTLRYKEFLQECFTSLRISIGFKIRDAIEKDKPLDGKFLNIPLIEKLMKLEFALHGLPIDIKGYLHASKKNSKDKTEEELLESLNDIKDMVSKANDNKFDPSKFVSDNIIDVEVEEEQKNKSEGE